MNKALVTIASAALIITASGPIAKADLWDNVTQNKVFRVGDIEGGSSGNFLPEDYRKGLQIRGSYCSGLPELAKFMFINIDMDKIDDSSGQSKFEARAFVKLSFSESPSEAPTYMQFYDITGKYEDGGISILTAKPVDKISNNDEARPPILKGELGVYSFAIPSLGETFQTFINITEYPKDVNCIVSNLYRREKYTSEQWDKLHAKAEKIEDYRDKPIILFDKLDLAERNKKSRVDKIIKKAGGKFTESKITKGFPCDYYDSSEVIPGTTQIAVQYVEEDGDLYLFGVDIQYAGSKGKRTEDHPIEQQLKALQTTYGPDHDSIWRQKNGNFIQFKRGYTNAVVTYANYEFAMVAEAQLNVRRDEEEKENQAMFKKWNKNLKKGVGYPLR